MMSDEIESNEFIIQFKAGMPEIDKEISDETKQNCKSLKIINCQHLETSPQFLSFINKLDSLEIIECDFKGQALRELKSNQLRRLVINKCGIKDADIEAMDLPSLEVLDLSHNILQSLLSIKMSNLPKLKTLILASNSLIFKNVDAFMTIFTELAQKFQECLNNINLASNPFEQKITGYQIILLKLFKGRLETLNNANVAGINTDDLRFLDDADNQDNQRNGGGFGAEVNAVEDGQENNFQTLIDLIEEALGSPSEANKKMTDLKKYVQIFKKAKGNPFNETDSYKLKNDIETFIKVITLLIENQESTQDLVVEILCHLTVIVQQDFGIRSYATLSYLAKKNKILRRKVLFTMKELCLRNFYQKDLSAFNHKYLEAFLNVIEENSMEEIIGSGAYIYLEGWLNDIYLKNFKLEGSASQMIKQVFRMLSIVASNPAVLFQETIINLLSTNMFCKARKMQRELKSDYYIFAEYISYTLMKYCERSNPDKINTSAILFNDTNFFTELINEINDIRREITGQDSASKSALAPSFDKLLGLLSTILQTYVPLKHAHSAPVVIRIDNDPRFSRESNTNIIYEIASLHKANIDITFKSSVYRFISATLENTKLVAKTNTLATVNGESEASHGNLVKTLTDIIDQATTMLQMLAKTNEYAADSRYIAMSCEICQVIYYYTYHSCDHQQADRSIQETCIQASKLLNDMNRDTVLFNCLEVPNDRLKLIIVKVLNSIRPEQYDDPELRKLWAILKEHRNVGAGKNEIIIGTILLILTKIKQHSEQEEKDFSELQSRDKMQALAKEKQFTSSREKLTFIRTNFANFVNLGLELLRKNMSRDLKDDEDEQQEKNTLSLCIITMMKSMLKPPIPTNISIETSENLEYIGSILVDESMKNPRDNVICEIEATIGASNAKYMLEFTRKVNIKSYTFTRILAHIADIMEGDVSASNETIVPQNVLLEDLLTQTQQYKESKIQKELADFKNFDDEEFIIGKFRQEWAANNRLSVEDIGEIHKEIFNDRGVQGLFSMILKVINAENEVVEYGGDQEEEKLRHKYDEAKASIFNRRSKVLTGQQFLVKKLSKAKDDKHFEEKVNKVTAQFRYDTSKMSVGETIRFQLVPLIPDLVRAPGSKQEAMSLKPVVPKNYLYAKTDEEFCQKLFVLDLCAILRMIYNGMILGVKQDVVLEMLNDKTFLKRILKACNTAGWDNGYLSSKYLRLVKLSVEANSSSKGKSEGFKDKLTFYYMIFRSLANILDYFLQKFKKENVKIFSESQLSLLFEIVKTTHTTMITVKDYITIENKSASADIESKEASKGKDKRFYDLYSDKEATPLQEIIRWVMSTYVPPRFIQIFVQILSRIEARVQEAKFEVKRRTVSWLIEVISEYLSIFPNLRYDVIKHFYDFEQSEDIKVRASLIANILKRSFFTSKMLRVAEYMTTEEAGKAYLSEDKTVYSYSYCYFVENTKKMFPIYIVFCKKAIYLLKETLEKPSQLVSMDSLSPSPPQCYEVIKYSDLTKVHKNVDQTSLRLFLKGGNSILLDFMSSEVLEKTLPFILNPPATGEDSKEASKSVEYNNHSNRVRFKEKECDYMFSVAAFASDQDTDGRSFTEIVLKQPKSILAIFDKTLTLLEPDFSENAYKEYYVKNNPKVDGMYNEIFSMDVETVKKLEFPNLESPKATMEGKGGGGKFRHLVFFEDQDREHFKFAMTELQEEGYNIEQKNKWNEVPIQ